MRVLITGVCGFIGSHLARRLSNNGWQVTGIDNLSLGFENNITDLIAKNDFQFVKLDVTDPQFLSRFEKDNFDVIIHFASLKTPRYGNRMEVLDVNALGTENVLNLACNKKARFIYGSTGEIYGKSPEIPFTEESGFCLGKPEIRRWSSVVSQMYSEHLCFAYNEKFDLDFTIIRYFNIYGPGQRMDWLGGPQAVFIQNALVDKPLEIHGDGVQSRDFSYIDDAVDGTLQIMESRYASGEIVNIGNETKISIINLAYMIWRLSGNPNKPKLKFLAYTDLPHLYEDIRHRSCDTTKARCLLGYQPKTSLEEGLKSTIAWHRSKMAPPAS